MNSNTIAMTVLLGLPFLWLLADSADAGKVRKAIAYAMMVVAVVALVRTGSREGMVALGILSVSVFLRSSATGKLKIVAASFMFCAAFVVFVPHSLLSRFSTIFQGAHVELSESDDATTEEKKLMISAAGSSEDRWNLLVGSLRLTAENPVFGVGPGNFSAYIAKEAALKGVWTNWNGTHNTYTQLSAEAGIPGVCLFVLALGLCMRELKRIYRRAGRIPGRQARDIAVMALAVRCSFISYLICALFTHLGYDLMMPLMCGIVVAMSRTAPEELARLEREMDNSGSAPASPPASSPAPPRAAAVRPGPVRTPRDAYPSRAGRQAPQVR
jgi:O-antigen ligase